MASVDHPLLKTTFNGILHPHSTSKEHVYQFRGIKFAKLSDRFHLAVLNESFTPETDATKHGPACPQLPFPLKAEEFCLGASPERLQSVQVDETKATDEFECLNLVINTPPLSEFGQKPLPVLVWIHGGGCEWGHNSTWYADGSAIVARSISTGRPIVFVSMNYRLSVFGWSTSEFLGTGDLSSPTGGIGNYGLHDAHLAMEWVYKFIEPFGGDPENITVGGESGGAAVVHNLLNSRLPARFTRAIIQSATPLSHRPRLLADKSAFMDDMMKAIGISDINELRQKAPLDLLRVYWGLPGPFNASPSIDGLSLDDDWERTVAFAPNAAREILVGDMGTEGTLWVLIAQNGWTAADPSTATEFLSALKEGVGDSWCIRLAKIYGISPEVPLSQLYAKILDILGDFAFISPTNSFISNVKAGAKVFRYAFDKRNPFPGDLEGSAGHALDLAYLFGSPELFKDLPTSDAEIMLLHAIQDRWIGFVSGVQPWKSVNNGRYVSIAADGGIKELDLDRLGEQRRLDACELFNGLTWEEKWQLHQLCVATMRSHLQVLRGQTKEG